MCAIDLQQGFGVFVSNKDQSSPPGMTDYLSLAELDNRLESHRVIVQGGHILPRACYKSQLDVESFKKVDKKSDPMRKASADSTQCPFNAKNSADNSWR